VWAKKFADKNLPIVGDDIKAQLGATVLHRMIVDLFRKRGVKVERTYQLNTGGNTDFLNMLNRTRLASKKTSKTEAVQSVMGERLADENIHIGPSDYVPWQLDNKIAFIHLCETSGRRASGRDHQFTQGFGRQLAFAGELRSAERRLGGQLQRDIRAEPHFLGAVSQRLDYCVNKGRAASAQRGGNVDL